MLIAFSGKKQTGKDTAADILAENSPALHFQRLNFADAVYEELAIALWPGCKHDKSCLIERVRFMKDNKDNFRLLLQGWGTDYRRKMFGSMYWIDIYKRRLAAIPNDYVVLTTDVRFLNEAECIYQLGGVLIRMERVTWHDDIHQSEVELDDYPFEFVIQNNGTKEDLLKELKQTIKQINK